MNVRATERSMGESILVNNGGNARPEAMQMVGKGLFGDNWPLFRFLVAVASKLALQCTNTLVVCVDQMLLDLDLRGVVLQLALNSNDLFFEMADIAVPHLDDGAEMLFSSAKFLINCNDPLNDEGIRLLWEIRRGCHCSSVETASFSCEGMTISLRDPCYIETPGRSVRNQRSAFPQVLWLRVESAGNGRGSYGLGNWLTKGRIWS